MTVWISLSAFDGPSFLLPKPRINMFARYACPYHTTFREEAATKEIGISTGFEESRFIFHVKIEEYSRCPTRNQINLKFK